MSIDYSMFRSIEVGSSSSGASPSAPSLRYTHVANTRRFYINKPLMKKLDFSMKENDSVRFQIKLGKNEDGHDALFICKEFDKNEPYARGSVKNGVLVFYSTPIGDWIEERIGEVELNKTKALTDISFDCFNDHTVAIITLPFAVNEYTPLSERRTDEIVDEEEQVDESDDELYEEMDEEEFI